MLIPVSGSEQKSQMETVIPPAVVVVDMGMLDVGCWMLSKNSKKRNSSFEKETPKCKRNLARAENPFPGSRCLLSHE